jgi:hypothetical protein
MFRRRARPSRSSGEARSTVGSSAPSDTTSPMDDPAFVVGLRPIPSGSSSVSESRPASDLVGVSPAGDRVEVVIGELDRLVLLCFLHIRCDGCEQFWQGLRHDGSPVELPDTVTAVVVTKGPGSVEPVEVARLAAGLNHVPVVMSDDAWTDYLVSAYPFFVLVEPGSRSVLGESVGFGWSDVRSMISAAPGH